MFSLISDITFCLYVTLRQHSGYVHHISRWVDFSQCWQFVTQQTLFPNNAVDKQTILTT